MYRFRFGLLNAINLRNKVLKYMQIKEYEFEGFSEITIGIGDSDTLYVVSLFTSVTKVLKNGLTEDFALK